MEKKTILVAEHIDKRFGITHAVNDVSLTIAAGEIRGLIGENGSGKSTFCQMLCGIYTIGGGTFKLEGEELHIRNQVDANNAGIAIIVQEMGTLSGLTVAENIFLGHEEPFMHMGIKDSGSMNREAQKLLDSYGFGRIKAGVMIDHYNFEDRKLIEIVKATYMKPKILVIDETTAWSCTRSWTRSGQTAGPSSSSATTWARCLPIRIRFPCCGTANISIRWNPPR